MVLFPIPPQFTQLRGGHGFSNPIYSCFTPSISPKALAASALWPAVVDGAFFFFNTLHRWVLGRIGMANPGGSHSNVGEPNFAFLQRTHE